MQTKELLSAALDGRPASGVDVVAIAVKGSRLRRRRRLRGAASVVVLVATMSSVVVGVAGSGGGHPDQRSRVSRGVTAPDTLPASARRPTPSVPPDRRTRVKPALAPVLEQAGSFTLRDFRYISNKPDGGDSGLGFIASVAMSGGTPMLDNVLRVGVSPAAYDPPIRTCAQLATAIYLADRPRSAHCRANSPTPGVNVVIAKGRSQRSGHTTTMVIRTGRDQRVNLVQLTVGPPGMAFVNDGAKHLSRPALSEAQLVDLSETLSQWSAGG